MRASSAETIQTSSFRWAIAYAEAVASEIAQEFPLIVKPYGGDVLLHQLGQILGDSR